IGELRNALFYKLLIDRVVHVHSKLPIGGARRRLKEPLATRRAKDATDAKKRRRLASPGSMYITVTADILGCLSHSGNKDRSTKRPCSRGGGVTKTLHVTPGKCLRRLAPKWHST